MDLLDGWYHYRDDEETISCEFKPTGCENWSLIQISWNFSEDVFEMGINHMENDEDDFDVKISSFKDGIDIINAEMKKLGFRIDLDLDRYQKIKCLDGEEK